MDKIMLFPQIIKHFFYFSMDKNDFYVHSAKSFWVKVQPQGKIRVYLFRSCRLFWQCIYRKYGTSVRNGTLPSEQPPFISHTFLIRCDSSGSALMRPISSATICLTSFLMR